jgi:hypothetical protein
VARLADHHDGLAHSPRPAPAGALRVFDGHVEVDVVLAAGHAVPTTAAALRAALVPLLAGRAVHVTVTDVEADPAVSTGTPTHRQRGYSLSDPNRGEHARVVARSVLANLESLQAEGLGSEDITEVRKICRLLDAFEADQVSRTVLVRRLRELLGSARGLTGRTFVGWLADIDAT